MDNQIIADPIFCELELNSDWIESGIIDNNTFSIIKKEYLKLKEEDSRTEHYRWAAFKEFLNLNNHLEAEVFYKLYNLGKNEPDYAMGRSMIFEIIKRLDCPIELIDVAINDSDYTLSKHALKCKAVRQ